MPRAEPFVETILPSIDVENDCVDDLNGNDDINNNGDDNEPIMGSETSNTKKNSDDNVENDYVSSKKRPKHDITEIV